MKKIAVVLIVLVAIVGMAVGCNYSPNYKYQQKITPVPGATWTFKDNLDVNGNKVLNPVCSNVNVPNRTICECSYPASTWLPGSVGYCFDPVKPESTIEK